MRLREFLYMHKSDRQIILTALFVAIIALSLAFLTNGRPDDTPLAEAPTSDSLLSSHGSHPSTLYYAQTEEQPVIERFAFDPNTADSTQLLHLGLLPWQVRNIYRYRAAGGIYRTKEDFAQLYGLTVKQYRELEPYISISADYQPASTLFQHRNTDTDTLSQSHKLREGEQIDLATADTTLLKQVPGIGSYFARRITDYRHRLGGFVNLNQLDEIDGFPQQAKAYLTLSAPQTERININRLSLNELKRHPYINYYQARAITDYRRQHGPITHLQELQLLPDFTSEALSRLEPYVEY